ncbi:ANTAR domain-containing response regulator [Falsiruegeria mediterranea]|jgi:two-component system, response regulator / RNA-binding antiterminator|uniref:Putative transcriptional regulatory protein pdtaR n=1 Tax=Falsiruegeria mediterranea M17 TaxID=1200281 RepID=A0A2R8CES1_9RHOB|nr:ANTAR domain-containing protein [Falsiruegeria mediterranea]SPJ30943.1 putative transcriptional regulatory protein pdtaR [Falsiruegeria mediterranea M17]
MPNPLSICVVEKDAARAKEITEALHQGGWADVTVITDDASLTQTLASTEPDLVLIDLANPRRDTLETLSEASGARQRPVAMFVDESDPELSTAAIQAGVSAYVVGGLSGERIRPVLETAIARFRMMTQMQSELEAAKKALAERKTIDRAKGLLIQAKGLSEDDAYRLMRKAAMDQGKRLIDVAQALVTASELLR